MKTSCMWMSRCNMLIAISQEAANALEMYQTITDHTSRSLFLSSFEKESSGGKMNFKWVHDFKKSLVHENTTEIGATEDMLTRAQVLKHLGLTLTDFKNTATSD